MVMASLSTAGSILARASDSEMSFHDVSGSGLLDCMMATSSAIGRGTMNPSLATVPRLWSM